MFLTRQSRSEPIDQAPLALGSPLVWFLLAHVPLAFLLRYVSIVSWLHVFALLGTGLYWAWRRTRPEYVANVVGYIIGAEILWRMTNTSLYWETAKYSVTLILGVALLRASSLRGLVVPALAFGLLLPSAARTYLAGDWAFFRNQISFNLSGPLSLVMSAAFFHHVTLPPGRLQHLFFVMLAPIVSVGTLVLAGIVTTPVVEFTFESNFDLSGGYGPNQVSSVLGLGALIAFLALLGPQRRTTVRGMCFVLMCWLGFQAALTFSRGGVLGAIGAAGLALMCLATQPRDLLKTIPVLLLLYAVGAYWIWPALDRYTDGHLGQRFADTSTTHRGTLFDQDLEIFAEHPMLGVGPGVSPDLHEHRVATHTEFSRLLAEHGLLGITFMLVLLGAAVWNVWRTASAHERGVVAAALLWAALFMGHSAMRLVAPSVMFGIGMTTLVPGVRRTRARARPLKTPRHRQLLGAPDLDSRSHRLLGHA